MLSTVYRPGLTCVKQNLVTVEVVAAQAADLTRSTFNFTFSSSSSFDTYTFGRAALIIAFAFCIFMPIVGLWNVFFSNPQRPLCNPCCASLLTKHEQVLNTWVEMALVENMHDRLLPMSCRHLSQTYPHMVSQLISHLNPVLSSLYYPQRIMATAVFGEVIKLLVFICSFMSLQVCILFRAGLSFLGALGWKELWGPRLLSKNQWGGRR